jgi:acyl-coenzyme A thioesterase PaaI-like protein
MNDGIRRRVLEGIALNRTPGFHFAGNFLGIEIPEVGANTRVTMEPGTHCVDANGETHIAVVFMVADIALATAIRAQLDPSQRLATVSMHLQLNGAPLAGSIEASGEFEGFASGGMAQQGLSRVRIRAGGVEVGFGHGAFMALDPPPGLSMFPLQPTRMRKADLPDEATLNDTERDILRRADAALAPGEGSFISRFLGIAPRKTQAGASCVLQNGLHVGNRVGHAQGGILMGLAAGTAAAAVGSGWTLASISAAFVSPGEGDSLEATSSTVHRGRWTAAARTEVIVPGGRRVLEVATTHAHGKE